MKKFKFHPNKYISKETEINGQKIKYCLCKIRYRSLL